MQVCAWAQGLEDLTDAVAMKGGMLDVVDVLAMVVVDVEEVVDMFDQGKGSLLERDISLNIMCQERQRSDFLTLAQIANTVFPAASDAIIYKLLDDAYPAEDDDGDLQGTIHLTLPQNDADCDEMREELDCLVSSATSNEVNVEKVL